MLEQLELGGYRLLDGFRADFGRLTVVIGANACGKSTLIDSLAFVTDAMQNALDDVLSRRVSAGSIRSATRKEKTFGWKLTFTKPKDHPVWSRVPVGPDQQIVYEATIGEDTLQQAIPVHEALRNANPLPGYSSPFKMLEARGERAFIFDKQQKKLVAFNAPAPAEAANAEAPSPTPEMKWLLLGQMNFINEYPIPTWIRGMLANFYYYPGFDVGRFSSLRTQFAEIRPNTALNWNGDNLGAVLHEILTRYDHHEQAEEIKGFLRSAYPFFQDITAETAFGRGPRILLRVREANVPRAIEVWELSDGVLRMLCLAAALLNPVPPALIAIDEPEAGLHPRLLPIVAGMIKAASERTQVLITTHSPQLLNCFDVENVAVMARQDGRATWSRPAERKSLRRMLENVVGDSLGDLHTSGELEAMA